MKGMNECKKKNIKKEVKKYLMKGYGEVYNTPSMEEAAIEMQGRKGGSYLKKLIRGKKY